MKIGLAWLPVGCVVCTVLGIVISCGIAVAQHNVAAVLPYFSYAANTAPETYIFSFLLSVGSYFGAGSVYVRYKLLASYLTSDGVKRRSLQRTNIAGLLVGYVSFLAISVLSNFQSESSEVWAGVVNDIATAVSAFSAVVYIWIESVLSLYSVGTCKSPSTRSPAHSLHGYGLFVTRFLLGIMTTIAFVLSVVFVAIAATKFDGTDELHWSQQNAAYKEHIVGAIPSYFLTFFGLLWLLTFIVEFRFVRLAAQPLKFDWLTCPDTDSTPNPPLTARPHVYGVSNIVPQWSDTGDLSVFQQPVRPGLPAFQSYSTSVIVNSHPVHAYHR